MRTVHETEALRPSDPVPKHHNVAASAAGTPTATPSGKIQRLKLKLSFPPKDDAGDHSESANEEAAGLEDDLHVPPGGLEKEFDTYEMLLEGPQLYRLLLRQIHWAQQDGAELRDAWEKIRVKRKESWMEKEAIFDDLMEAEVRLFKLLDEKFSVAKSAPANGTDNAPQSEPRQSEPTEMDVAQDQGSGSVPP